MVNSIGLLDPALGMERRIISTYHADYRLWCAVPVICRLLMALRLSKSYQHACSNTATAVQGSPRALSDAKCICCMYAALHTLHCQRC